MSEKNFINFSVSEETRFKLRRICIEQDVTMGQLLTGVLEKMGEADPGLIKEVEDNPTIVDRANVSKKAALVFKGLMDKVLNEVLENASINSSELSKGICNNKDVEDSQHFLILSKYGGMPLDHCNGEEEKQAILDNIERTERDLEFVPCKKSECPLCPNLGV